MNPIVERMRDAVNRHDPEGMAACMRTDYRSDQPVHPNRHFVGNQQVIANWTEMFKGLPDLVAEVVAEATEGTTSFSEWAMRGHYPDGAEFEFRGVIVAGIEDGLIAWQRLYLETVEQDSAEIEEVVHQLSRN
ncbi:nuclear transport factor 2 family protein [Petropleomorpha daqingensis]|uniref:Ketosteroid isomerase-like protein n=1 Tax=Petropleomorpha daqingensis TaxID=2026353 RepID=A0A853C9M1_9ACTN|nr:ketosteroid isomerase-like protein [Petropleomorpha daqingensis]